MEYTQKEALLLYDMVLPPEIKDRDKSRFEQSPREIIFKAARVLCITTGDEAWEKELGPALEKYLFELPIEETPLMINEPELFQTIAKWRLSIGR